MSTGYRLTAEQSMLREALRELCATESTAAHVLEVWQEERPFDQGLWQALAANGWLGLCSDEAYGGAGLGIVELSLLAEELGRTAAAAPILTSLIAGLVLRESGATSELSALVAVGSGHPALTSRSPARAARPLVPVPLRTVRVNPVVSIWLGSSTGWTSAGTSGSITTGSSPGASPAMTGTSAASSSK
jgi:hypothetical protein